MYSKKHTHAHKKTKQKSGHTKKKEKNIMREIEIEREGGTRNIQNLKKN